MHACTSARCKETLNRRVVCFASGSHNVNCNMRPSPTNAAIRMAQLIVQQST